MVVPDGAVSVTRRVRGCDRVRNPRRTIDTVPGRPIVRVRRGRAPSETHPPDPSARAWFRAAAVGCRWTGRHARVGRDEANLDRRRRRHVLPQALNPATAGSRGRRHLSGSREPAASLPRAGHIHAWISLTASPHGPRPETRLWVRGRARTVTFRCLRASGLPSWQHGRHATAPRSTGGHENLWARACRRLAGRLAPRRGPSIRGERVALLAPDCVPFIVNGRPGEVASTVAQAALPVLAIGALMATSHREPSHPGDPVAGDPERSRPRSRGARPSPLRGPPRWRSGLDDVPSDREVLEPHGVPQEARAIGGLWGGRRVQAWLRSSRRRRSTVSSWNVECSMSKSSARHSESASRAVAGSAPSSSTTCADTTFMPEVIVHA